jgi:hypothetical protein
MYEHRTHRPLPRALFVRRLLLHGAALLLLLTASLVAGMVGYVRLEHLGWLDAFLKAAMLLGGMGPVDMPRTAGGTLFAGLFALCSGLLLLSGAGLVLAPVMQRILHRFHWDEDRQAVG